MLKAREIMSTNVITIVKDEDIYEALRTMVLNNITGLPVVNEDGTLAGIITEKDILTLLGNGEDRPGRVRDFMTANVVCFDQEDTLDDVAESFRNNHFRRVPILDQGRLVGIISRRDIIRYMGERKRRDDVLNDSILEILY